MSIDERFFLGEWNEGYLFAINHATISTAGFKAGWEVGISCTSSTRAVQLQSRHLLNLSVQGSGVNIRTRDIVWLPIGLRMGQSTAAALLGSHLEEASTGDDPIFTGVWGESETRVFWCEHDGLSDVVGPISQQYHGLQIAVLTLHIQSVKPSWLVGCR